MHSKFDGFKRLVPDDPRSSGHDLDYRFTLANERTFLAWIRTALALAAGGLGVISLLDSAGSKALGLLLLGLSVVTAATSYRRWALNEQAMRTGQPLQASRLTQFMAAGVAIVGLACAVLFVVGQV